MTDRKTVLVSVTKQIKGSAYSNNQAAQDIVTTEARSEDLSPHYKRPN